MALFFWHFAFRFVSESAKDRVAHPRQISHFCCAIRFFGIQKDHIRIDSLNSKVANSGLISKETRIKSGKFALAWKRNLPPPPIPDVNRAQSTKNRILPIGRFSGIYEPKTQRRPVFRNRPAETMLSGLTL